MATVIPPAGTSAAGFFTPVEFADPAKPPAYLARLLDPKTGDWKSILTGMHPVDAAVLVAVRVRRGSGASVENAGNRFAEIKKNDQTAAARIRFEATAMVQHLLDRSDIRIEQLLVEADPGGDIGAVDLIYRNLRTGEQKRVQLT